MTASIQPDRISQHDSPTLWLSVLAGSLAVHLLILFAGRWYFSQPSAPARRSPAAIDFVEVSPVPTAPSVAPKSQATSVPEAPRPPTSSQSTSTPSQREVAPSEPRNTDAASDAAIQSRSAPSSTPTASPQQEPPSQASPRPSPSTPKPSPQERPLPGQVPSQSTPSNSPAPSAPSGRPSQSSSSSGTSASPTTPNPSNPGGSTSGGSTTSGNPSGPATGFPLPPAPDTSLPNVPNSSGGTQIGKAPIDSNPAPASFSVTVGLGDVPRDNRVEGPSAPGVKEIPDEPAQPKSTTQTIETSGVSGECLLKPEAKNYYTKTVKLRLAINEQGQVMEKPYVVQSSGNSAYDELAQCVIKRWEFLPAYNLQGEKKNAVPSNLDVPVRIDAK